MRIQCEIKLEITHKKMLERATLRSIFKEFLWKTSLVRNALEVMTYNNKTLR